MNHSNNSNQDLNSSEPKIPIEGYSFKWWNQIKFTQIFTALKYPNYRLWFWGQLISLFGSWMQTTALGFLIFELTHSPIYLGFLGFAFGIPTWIFMLYGGVIADRISKRTLLIITQSAMMFFALVLALLTFLGAIQPWQLITIAFILGIANAFDAPARQAFVLDMVDRESLTNAIALNSTMFNSATALGPAAGGIIYALFGPAWCFTINSISFLAVILSLSRMKLKPVAASTKKSSTIKDLVEGMKFVIHHKIIRTIILMVAMTTIFGISYVTLLPAWAVKILHGDATTNGLLQSARGVGALLGALFIASLGKFRFKGMLLTIGSFTFPIFVIVFSFMGSTHYSLLSLVGVGISMMFIFNMANSIIQLLVPDELRGRIMGIY
ncbi:MAG: MFS transporter, partial [Ignavibacteriaceae bacterium]|nr:MFS transporter [Ignavibacteriaceae bacterium]